MAIGYVSLVEGKLTNRCFSAFKQWPLWALLVGWTVLQQKSLKVQQNPPKKKKKTCSPAKKGTIAKKMFFIFQPLKISGSMWVFRGNITWQIRGSRAYVSKGLSGSIASLEYWEFYERCCGFKFILPSSYDVVMPILSGVLISHKIHVL